MHVIGEWPCMLHFNAIGSTYRFKLRLVFQGDTTDALMCLANYPFLLAYDTYATDGDTVSTGIGIL